VLAALLWWAAGVAAAIAGLQPRRRLGAILLAVLGVLGVLGAVVEGGAERTLEVVHTHPAYVANEVVSKDFPVETTRAPGYAHWLAGAAFCLVLAGLGFAGLPARWPFGWAIALAYGGTALALVLEKFAAPAAAVAFRREGSIWLAAVLTAVALAEAHRNVFVYAAVLLLMIDVLWLPSAAFSTVATLHELGTSLDVHGIEYCAHRLAGTPLELVPKSAEQLWYLVFAPLLVVYPVLTWLSAGGIGFLALMLHRERAARRAA